MLLKEGTTAVTALINFKSKKKKYTQDFKDSNCYKFCLRTYQYSRLHHFIKMKIQIQMSTGSLVPFGTNIQSVKRYGESLFCPRGVCRVTLPARDLMWRCLIPASPGAVWEQTEVWGSSSRCSLPLVSPDCSTRAELGSFTALPSAAIAVAKQEVINAMINVPTYPCMWQPHSIHTCVSIYCKFQFLQFVTRIIFWFS